MQAPKWLKPSIMGAIAGGIATMILGFNFGGWYLGSTAETLADKQSKAAVITALVPICVDRSQTDPDSMAKLQAFKATKTSYEQRDYVMKAGWATMPATEAPNQALATACAEVLSKTTGS
jgi:hypothetical protein